MSDKALKAAVDQLNNIGENGSFLLINKDSGFKYSGTVSLEDLKLYKTGIEELIAYREKRMAQLGKSANDRTSFLNEAAGSIYAEAGVSNLISTFENILKTLVNANNSTTKKEE